MPVSVFTVNTNGSTDTTNVSKIKALHFTAENSHTQLESGAIAIALGAPSGGTPYVPTIYGGFYVAGGYSGSAATTGRFDELGNISGNGSIKMAGAANVFGVSTTLVPNGDMPNGSVTFGVDGSGDLIIKLKDNSGTIRTATIDLS